MSNKVLASPIQNSHWLQLQNNPHQKFDVATISSVFMGTLDPSKIKECLNNLITSFEILRTGYETDEYGVLWQKISTIISINFIELDWRDLSDVQISEEKNKINQNQDSDNIKHPWHRVVFAKVKGSSWLFLEFSSQNTDSFSLNYLMNILVEAGCDKAFSPQVFKQEDVIQYQELAPWLADFLIDEELAEARAFWTREKSVAAINKQFPLQQYKDAETKQYRVEKIELGSHLGLIQDFAAQEGASIAEVVCAGLRLSLAKFDKDVSLSRVFDSRADEALAEAVGPLSRTLPLFPVHSMNLTDAVKREHDCTVQGVDYNECFVKVHEIETESFAFIFDCLVCDSQKYTLEHIFSLPEKCRLHFMLISQGENTYLQVTYAHDYIDTPALEYFLEYFNNCLLSSIKPDDVSLPSSYLMMGPDVTNLPSVNVLSVFEQGLSNGSGAIIEMDGATASFLQINERANRFAHYLLENGIGKGDAIALCLIRSIDFVVAMLAVMKTGAAYVPVDIELPVPRITSMLQDAQAKVLISQGELNIEGCKGIDYSTVNLEQYAVITPEIKINNDDLAYILFTSGSTGKAKGISISHKALLNHMTWINHEFLFNSQDRFLQRTSASFDASIWEFWSPLLVGGTMVIAPNEINYDLSLFQRSLLSHKITRMQIVPSLLDILVDNISDSNSLSLKSIFSGGEALQTSTAKKAQLTFGCEVVNLYGPSECCIDALFWRFDASVNTDFVPIGFPINNLTCRVLKDDGELAGIGESGELQVAGDSVFTGYHNQVQLTTEVLQYCDQDKKLYYHSGDNVRILPDGNLMFMGRFDDQVKLNGFRVELDEISMLILTAQLVAQAKCVFNKVTNSISLFYIGAKTEKEQISLFLSNSLPEYMIPHQLIELDEFPYLSNGKLNKRVLREKALNYSSVGYVVPSNDIESELLVIWLELLDTSLMIGVTHDFFAVGGHSLLAMKLLNRINKQFEIAISVRVLFEYKTIAELATYIEPLTLLVNANSTNEDDLESGLL
jgi:amino acid adenylation domain-containing protein